MKKKKRCACVEMLQTFLMGVDPKRIPAIDYQQPRQRLHGCECLSVNEGRSAKMKNYYYDYF